MYNNIIKIATWEDKMKNSLKFLVKAACMFLFILFFSNLNSIQASATVVKDQTRYNGDNRFETAVSISKGGWTKSENVIITYAYNFPDSLSGVPFAYIKDAPILLTRKDSLPGETFNEIKRLGAKNIYILGGTPVVSDSVKNSLTSKGYNVIRVSGENRFETAIKIANEVNKKNSSKTAVLAINDNYPDALAISPYAARKNIPILYTRSGSLETKTRSWLKSNGITKVIIVGSTDVISENVANQLKSDNITVQRIAGGNRYSTALNIAKTFESTFNNDFFVATGEDFPDALAGGVLAAKRNMPIFLAQQNSMRSDVEQYLSEKGSVQVFVLGSTKVIKESVQSYLKKIIVVDPGHDYGKDYGAVSTINGVKYEETVLNMEVADKLKSSLESRGYRVYMTRELGEKPASTSLQEALQSRTDFANSKNADLFLSIHHDVSGNSNTSGISTHYSTYKPGIDNSGIETGNDPNGWYNGVEIDKTPSEAAKLSKELADKIAADLASKMGYSNKLSHDHNLYVTVNTNMPSVLIECGFISNPEEAKRSADSSNQKKLAETIADSVKQILK